MAVNATRKAIQFLVQGALPPHDTNVLWMDTSSPEYPVLKTWENGAWTTVTTTDSKVYNMLIETIYAQQQEITALQEDVAKEQTVVDGITTIDEHTSEERENIMGGKMADYVEAIVPAAYLNNTTYEGCLIGDNDYELDENSSFTLQGDVAIGTVFKAAASNVTDPYAIPKAVNTSELGVSYVDNFPSLVGVTEWITFEKDKWYIVTGSYEITDSEENNWVIYTYNEFLGGVSVKEVYEKIEHIDFSEIAKQGSNPNLSLTTLDSDLGDVAAVLDYIENSGLPTIDSIAKQGSNTEATLTQTQAYAQNAYSEAAAAKTAAQGITGYATESNATSNKNAIIAAMPTIPTDYAKAGSGTNVTNTDLKSILNNIATTMYKGTPIQSLSGHGASAADPYTLEPNTWNQVSTAVAANSSLYFAKGADIANITNVYMVRFTLGTGWGSNSETVAFKNGANDWSLSWNGGSVPEWSAGNTYEISIVDNIACWIEIEPAS